MDGPTIEARTDVRRTKLLRPWLSNDVIPRPRLIERLGNGLDRPFTLLSTPAGYGKTTLLCQWLADSPLRSAWLQLDEQDNALPLFVAELIAAVRTVGSDFGQATIGLLDLPDLPPPAYIGATLADELLDLPEPLIIVLDDYHAIVDREVNEFLVALLNYPPPSLRLVLSSRVDPPLPVARWRGRDQLTELRAADLRFTMAETQAFLEQAAGQALSPSVVELLDARIEGWATGLRLVALSLQGAGEPSSVAAAFAGRRRQHATRYLLDEVLLGQPTEVQEFLLRTSIAEQICASLAEAVLDWPSGDGDAGVLLNGLMRSNVFVATLEPASDGLEWYRYHPLFRELLLLQLSEREEVSAIEDMHRRAAAWCLERGAIEQALTHLLAAGEPEQAVRVVEEHRHSLLNREAGDALARWLQLLPEELIRQRPSLLLAAAWVERLGGRWDAVARLVDAAAALLDGGSAVREPGAVEALHGEIDALRAFSSLVHGDGAAAASAAGRALTRLPANHVYGRGDAAIALGIGLYEGGHGAAVRREFSAILESHQGPPDAYTLRLLIALSLIHLRSGDLHALHPLAKRLLRLSTPLGMELCATWARYFLGHIAYEWNDLSGAAEHFSAAIAGHRHCQTEVVLEAWFGLALTYQAQERPAEAEALLAEFEGFLDTTGDGKSLTMVSSFRTRLAMARDERPPAAGPEVAAFPDAPAETQASPLPPAITGRANGLDSASLSHDTMEALTEQLTNRELQVLARLNHQLTSKEIATELSISPLTVKRHISNLSVKLGVSSRRLAVRRARMLGLLTALVLR